MVGATWILPDTDAVSARFAILPHPVTHRLDVIGYDRAQRSQGSTLSFQQNPLHPFLPVALGGCLVMCFQSLFFCIA
jgi:hypothetical protein